MAQKYLDETGLAYLWAKIKAYVDAHGGGSGTATPTANTTSAFDSSAKMNSTDMTSAQVSDFVDSLNVSGVGIINLIYPVGSVYISTNSTSPATLFGGTWVQIKGRFLLGTGTPDNNTNTYYGTNLTYDGTNKYNETAGSTGGESMHTLIEYEMPAHSHANTSAYVNASGDGTSIATPAGSYYGTAFGHVYNTSSVGGGGMHNNMPPYFAVYMWERTA